MTGNLELEKTLWSAADKLRNNMDAANVQVCDTTEADSSNIDKYKK